jgi:hypothetical protein
MALQNCLKPPGPRFAVRSWVIDSGFLPTKAAAHKPKPGFYEVVPSNAAQQKLRTTISVVR